MDDHKRSSINPAVWGSSYWKMLYYTAMSYPENNPSDETMRKFDNFFSSLQIILPCEKCRHHYLKVYKRIPIGPFLNSRENLLKWLIKLNNEVNFDLGKKPIDYPKKIKELYEEVDIHKKNNNNLKLVLIAVLIVSGVLLYKKYK